MTEAHRPSAPEPEPKPSIPKGRWWADPVQDLFSRLLLDGPPQIAAVAFLVLSLFFGWLTAFFFTLYLARSGSPVRVAIDDVPAAAGGKTTWVSVANATWLCDEAVQRDERAAIPLINATKDLVVLYLPVAKAQPCGSAASTAVGTLEPIHDGYFEAMKPRMASMRALSADRVYVLNGAEGPSDALAAAVMFGAMFVLFFTVCVFYARRIWV